LPRRHLRSRRSQASRSVIYSSLRLLFELSLICFAPFFRPPGERNKKNSFRPCREIYAQH
jgi:hypothetical protein